MHRRRGTSDRQETQDRRRHWVRVRVEMESGAYEGRLRFDGPRGTLRETVEDARAYLSLWDAVDVVTGTRDEHVAIHKGTIRWVVVLGEAGATAPAEA